MTQVGKYVYLQLKPEKAAEFRELLEANRQHTKIEPGTVQWTLLDVDGEPDSVAMFELYRDEAASAEHDASPALAPILERLGEFVAAEPVIHSLSYAASRDD